MDPLSVIVDSFSSLDAIRYELKDAFELHFYTVNQIKEIDPGRNVVFDIDVSACSDILEIKQWLATRPKGGKVIFVVDKASWHAQAQAAALGASCICNRPLNGAVLMSILLGDFDSLKDNNSPPMLRSNPAVGPTLDALENIFLSAHLGKPLDFELIDFAGKMLIRSIAEAGVAPWIEIVRTHHSRTYQHSLLVAGIIVAFAQYLRMTSADQQRLAFAAMLHDIGKARVPVSILEKPSKLDEDEMAVMRKHAEYGFEALASAMGVKKEIRDAVFHHHEHLDGSGYPHHLKGGQIPDLVRIVTISDIFGALIERRAYKNAMSCNTAYNTLLDMGPKLDPDLRREFRFVTELHVN